MNQNTDQQDPHPDFLPKPRKSAGFKVPEGYFNQMQHSVITELHQAGAFNQTTKKSSLFGNIWTSLLNSLSLKPVLATLVIVLCLGSGWYFFRDQTLAEQELALNDADIQSYILSHSEEFDDELVFKMTEKLNLDPIVENNWLEDQPMTDPDLMDQLEDLDEHTLDALIL